MDETNENALHPRRQSSRKSKKAWRKNIDLSSIDQGLESAREEVIQTGGPTFADIPSSSLFKADVKGSEVNKKKYPHANTRILRADQVLAARSAIPPVNTRKRSLVPSDSKNHDLANSILKSKQSKTKHVSAQEVEHLKQIAYGGGFVHTSVVAVPSYATYDPWTAPDESTENRNETSPQQSLMTGVSKISKYPSLSLFSDQETLSNILEPHPGRSYNPSFHDWNDLVTAAGEQELKTERARLVENVTEKERLQRIHMSSQEADRTEAEKENNLLLDHENEWEGIQSETDEAETKRRMPRRKTPAERNKIRRRQKAESLARHANKTKLRDIQLEDLEHFKQELKAKYPDMKFSTQGAETLSNYAKAHSNGIALTSKKRQLRQKLLPETPLELVLAEELQDSLRLLKPEGNLLKDRFRNLMVQGKLEPRKSITQPKKKRRKATEKWSYKDFEVRSR